MGNIQKNKEQTRNFDAYIKSQREVLFNKEISKGCRPTKGRKKQSSVKTTQLNINHESFQNNRVSRINFNNESIVNQGNKMGQIINNEYKNSIKTLTDNRTKVDIDKYPYTCIGMLQVNFENRRNRASAFLISSNWILTSAHNLYSRQYKKMGSDAVFLLGLQEKIEIIKENNRQIKNKIQIGQRFEISTWRIPPEYITLQSDEEAQLYDFALVKLKNVYFLQEKYGYFGLDSTWALRNNPCKELFIAGYPKEIKSNDNCKFLVEAKGPWTQILNQNEKQAEKGFIYLNYQIYTSPGQSGSPIFYQGADKQFYMIGIHTLGGDQYNSGVLMTPKNREMINGWIEEMKSIFDINNLNIGTDGFSKFQNNFTILSKNITELHLANNILGVQAMKMLMKNPWDNVKILNLQDNNIKTEGALCIADPVHGWVDLQYLNLNNTMIYDMGCISILKNRTWKKMKQLHLRKCHLTTPSIDELIRHGWHLLQCLTVSTNNFSFDDIAKLFSYVKVDENKSEKRFPYLKNLDVSKNVIGNQGLQLIIKCYYSLQNLAISGIGMTEQGMKFITEQKWPRHNILVLEVDWNKRISVEGIFYVTPANFQSISYLNLDWVTLGAQGIRQLIKHQWITLKSLSLNHNYLQDIGLNQLKNFKFLQVLIVEGNNITSKGIIQFSKKKEWQNLLQLNCRSNHIEKYGFMQAVRNLKGLNRLDINNNGLNSHHKRQIKEVAQNVNKQLQIQVDMGEEADF